MNHLVLLAIAGIMALGLCAPAHASNQRLWYVTSPDHGQTYAYGSQQSRAWAMLGPNKLLALRATYSNEPFAEGANRRYDNFVFNFPNITLGSDGVTFFYHTAKGLALPVAAQQSILFTRQINLLPTSYLLVKKLHGYLTLTLVIGDRPFEPNPETEIGIEH